MDKGAAYQQYQAQQTTTPPVRSEPLPPWEPTTTEFMVFAVIIAVLIYVLYKIFRDKP